MKLLSISQAADQLGVHQNTLRKWADQGIVACIKLPSGYRRFTQEQVDNAKHKIGLDVKAAA